MESYNKYNPSPARVRRTRARARHTRDTSKKVQLLLKLLSYLRRLKTGE